MDKAGRVVLPKAVRTKLGLAPGTEFSLEVKGDQLTLQPKRPSYLKRKNGRWVWDTGEPMDPDVISRHIEQLRNDRIKLLAGLE